MSKSANTTENQPETTKHNDEANPLDSTTNPVLLKEAKLDDDNTNTIGVSVQIALPTDGGWGWVVVTCSFLIYAITDGVMLTFGCLYRTILTDLILSPALVSLINSITVASCFLFGPVVSAIINRFGFRICVMVGSAVTSVSCFLTFLFGNYVSLLIFYGLLSGLGFAMINMPALIVVGFYFQRLRGVAFAISVTGGSIGVVVFSLFYSHMSQVVGWRYTVMFQASLIGLCYFIAMTFKPLLSMTVVKTTESTEKYEEPPAHVLSKITLKGANIPKKVSMDESTRRKSFHSNHNFPTAAEVITKDSRAASTVQMTLGPSRHTSTLAIIPSNKNADLHKNELERVKSLLNEAVDESEVEPEIAKERQLAKIKSLIDKDLPIKTENTKELQMPDDKKNVTKDTASSILFDSNRSRTGSVVLDGRRTRSILLDGRRTKSILMEEGKSRRGSIAKEMLQWEDHVAEARPLYRDDAFLSNTKSVLPTHLEQAEKNPIEYQLKVSRVATAEDLKEHKGLCTTAFTRVIFTMLDPTLLKRKSCLCVCLSMLLYYAAFLVPMIFVTDRGRDFGIPLEYSKWFLSAVGFSGIFGRLAITVIAMWLHPVYVLSVTLIMSGVATFLSIFGKTAVLQLLYCTILGIGTAGTAALRSVIFVKLYGLEKLTNCTGIAYVFQGVGCLVSPPLAGALKEYSNHIPFIFSSICFIGSGLLLLFVLSLVKKEDQAEKNKLVT